MSTAILMELDDVVLKQLEHIKTVDFTKTTTTVSLFETTVCAHKNFKTPPEKQLLTKIRFDISEVSSPAMTYLRVLIKTSCPRHDFPT